MRRIRVLKSSFGTHVHRIDCPLSARLRRNAMIAQALCESRPLIQKKGAIAAVEQVIYQRDWQQVQLQSRLSSSVQHPVSQPSRRRMHQARTQLNIFQHYRGELKYQW